MASKKENNGKNNVTARWLLVATTFFALLSFFAIGRIVYLQYFWKPDPRVLKMNDFKLQAQKHLLNPHRGNIIDCDGRLLAITIPTYRVDLDCGVRKEYYETLTDTIKKTGEVEGVKLEKEWREDARAFARALPGVLKDGSSATYFENEIIKRRLSNDTRLSKTLKIADDIDYATMVELKKLPLANRRQYDGGVIITPKYGRDYPYGDLARRTIGYVKNNDEGSTAKGIEGSLNYELHGKQGIEWRRMVDERAWVLDPDSTSIPVQNGHDIRLSLNIDIQDIADRAVRKHIEDDDNITDACMIIMDVKTGGIKAMVNLHKGKNGKFDETLNIALTQATDPGSVFKTVGLMTELEDKKTRLETRLNINELQSLPVPFEKKDEYLVKYKNRTGNSTISVREGLEISSNHVFTYLALHNYKSNPKEFISRYYDYGFGSDWKFDISGMAKTVLPDPDSKHWTPSDLGSIAYGYSVQVTPLHTLAFYNAIANKGNLVKPYLVEEVLDNGKTIRKTEPISLNETICSKATADTLRRALRCVVTNGTGSALRKAKCSVAGKTGTSRMIVPKERQQKRDPYVTTDGYRRYQGSFAGFFPAENPIYSAIVVVYSGLTQTPYYGGTRPANALREVIDEIYSLDPRWRETVNESSAMPTSSKKVMVTDKTNGTHVPNLIGMGLDDALYMIENNGYRCRFSGVGHVAEQSPAAGAKLDRGGMVTIVLK